MHMPETGSSPFSTLQSAVDYAWNKGVVIFAAAGNNSNSSPIYPAACNNVVAVSATDVNDVFASFSNYGSWIDPSAPGNNILTTMLGGGYGNWYGTSFSSPIVAGVAGLVLSIKPSLSNSALVSLLEQNSDDLGTPGWDQYFGFGRVNAYKAVLAAQSGGGIQLRHPSPSAARRMVRPFPEASMCKVRLPITSASPTSSFTLTDN